MAFLQASQEDRKRKLLYVASGLVLLISVVACAIFRVINIGFSIINNEKIEEPRDKMLGTGIFLWSGWIQLFVIAVIQLVGEGMLVSR